MGGGVSRCRQVVTARIAYRNDTAQWRRISTAGIICSRSVERRVLVWRRHPAGEAEASAHSGYCHW